MNFNDYLTFLSLVPLHQLNTCVKETTLKALSSKNSTNSLLLC